MNLLIPSAGNRYLHILSLRQLEPVKKLVTTEINPMAPGLQAADKCYRVPRIDSEDYLDAILKICKMEEIDWIVPLMDLDVVKFAENRDVFARIGVKVFSSPLETIKIAADKYQTAQFFKANSIPHPKTYLLSEMQEAIDETGFPLLLKPRYMNMRAGSNYFIEVFQSKDKLMLCAESIADHKYYVLQEYLKGREITIDFFCTGKGKVISIVPGFRMSALGPVFTKVGGTIVTGKTFHSEVLNKFIFNAADELEFFGPSNFQGFMNEENETKFTEINPRFTGAVVMTNGAGAKFYEWSVRLMKGEKLAPQIDAFDEVYMTSWHAPIFFKELPLQELDNF